MKKTKLISFALISVGCVFATMATAQQPPDPICDVFFDASKFCTLLGSIGNPCTTDADCPSNETCEDIGLWADPLNWLPSPPNANTVACIAPGETAQIKLNADVEVKQLWIQADIAPNPPLLGHVEMSGEEDPVSNRSRLTIHGDTRIDGLLTMFSNPLLIIGNSQITFFGGGTLVMQAEFDFSFTLARQPVIQCAKECIFSGGPTGVRCVTDEDCQVNESCGVVTPCTLTLLGAQTGAWNDIANSLVLTGGGIIDVDLVNRAHVKTARPLGLPGSNDVELRILKTASGDGFWVADRNDAVQSDVALINILGPVTGSATWVLTDDSAAIRFNYPNTLLTGDFVIKAGLLECNQHLSTTGNLEMTPDPGSTASIKVAEGYYASFD